MTKRNSVLEISGYKSGAVALLASLKMVVRGASGYTTLIGENDMSRALIPFLLFATPCWSHPGHGEALVHAHAWDWGELLTWLAIFAIAALTAWKSK